MRRHGSVCPGSCLRRHIGPRASDDRIALLVLRHSCRWPWSRTASRTSRNWLSHTGTRYASSSRNLSIWVPFSCEYPERHYIYSGARTQTVGKSGKQLPDVLYANRALVDEVNTELRRSGWATSSRLIQLLNMTRASRMYLRCGWPTVRRASTSASVTWASGSAKSFRDRPEHAVAAADDHDRAAREIHLHPRLQAELGDVFTRCIAPPRSNQFVIETHSEHLMLRLQSLIRRGRVGSPLCRSAVRRPRRGWGARPEPPARHGR